jgi:hypothetical protein
MPRWLIVEARLFVAGLVAVIVGSWFGSLLDMAWQPYGPSTTIYWGVSVATIGILLLIASYLAGGESKTFPKVQAGRS